MSNKPKAKQAESTDKAKIEHIQHLQRVKAALAAVGLEAPVMTIDLILKLNAEVAAKGNDFSLGDAQRVANDNHGWHTA
jgi:hypothetical protein